MSIHDRDYMKRPPDDDGDDSESWRSDVTSRRRRRSQAPDPAAGLERFFSGILRRYPHLPKIIGFILAALAIAALALARK